MDIVQIVFISAIVFPALAVMALMIFIKFSIRKQEEERMKYKEEKLKYEEREKTHRKIISSLEEVVDKQDMVLDVYRDSSR